MPNNVSQQKPPRRRGRPRLPAEKRRTHQTLERLRETADDLLDQMKATS